MADIDVVHKQRSSYMWVVWVVIALAVLALLWFMLGGDTGGAGAGGAGTAPATFHFESGKELARAFASAVSLRA
jgi:hypothetical protein